MKQLFPKIRRISRDISEKNIGIFAANASFFILLSIFPALMLLLSLLQYTPISSEDFLSAAESFLPSIVEPLLTYLVTDLYADNSVTLISVSAITALWSASRGVYSLLCGLNGIYNLRDDRSYFHKRMICIFYTLLLFAALLVTLVLHVFGQHITHFLESRDLPIFRLLLKLMHLRVPIMLALLVGLFTLIFVVFPNRRVRLLSALPGAAVSSVGWIGFTSLFSFYVNHFASYSRIYGSLTTVAVSMLWLYVCMSILFFGALVNYYLEQWRAAQPPKPKKEKKSKKAKHQPAKQPE